MEYSLVERLHHFPQHPFESQYALSPHDAKLYSQNNEIFDMHFPNYNHQDFPQNVFQEDDSVKKTGKQKNKLNNQIIRQRQLRRNERERARQNRLNDAFDVLRGTIPDFLAPYKKGQKLTQIETLRLARHYISSLKELLDTEQTS